MKWNHYIRYRMKRSTYNRLGKKAEGRRLILKKMFANFYEIKDVTVDRAVEIITPFVGVIESQLDWLAHSDYFGHDVRDGYATYGYDSDEIIIGNLQYISDRWNCQFRLRWVLDLLELKKKL
jgi:hypothetical protein